MFPSQPQDPLAFQVKQIIHLWAIYLDQDKFHLAQKEIQISLFPNVKQNGQTKSTGDFQTDKPTQAKIPDIG